MEFESDRLLREDLVRFRAAEALTSHIYGVDVVTSVLCTADVKSPMEELRTGINTYRVSIINMKQCDADEKIRRVEQIQEAAKAERVDLIELLLTPLMSGKMSVKERIRRTLLILQKERDRLEEIDYRRMSSILFAFAVKFLKKDEMSDLKEVFHMTVLGQMIYDDGIEKGTKIGTEIGTKIGTEIGAEKKQIEDISNLMDSMKLSAEQAMAALKIPEVDWAKYRKLIK